MAELAATKADIAVLKNEFDLLHRDMDISAKMDTTIQIVGMAIIDAMTAFHFNKK